MNHSKKASSQFFKAHGNSTIIFDFHKKSTLPDDALYNDDSRNPTDSSYFSWAGYNILLHSQKYTVDSPPNHTLYPQESYFL